MKPKIEQLLDGDWDGPWNSKRERLEREVVKACADLLAHTTADDIVLKLSTAGVDWGQVHITGNIYENKRAD